MLVINCFSNSECIDILICQGKSIVLKDRIKPGRYCYSLDNGLYNIYLITNDVRIIPIYLCNSLYISVCLDSNNNIKYFYLFDNNYNNLKIEKGEIILWQETIK